MRAAAGLLVLLALSCAPAPAPPAVVSIAPASPPPTVTAVTSAVSAAPAPDPMPPSIDGPAVVACLLRAPFWSSFDRPVALRATHTGRPYGMLSHGVNATLRIAADQSPDDPVLDLEVGSIVFRARVDPAAFPLHPAHAFVVGDAVIPRSSATLTWGHASPGALELTMALPATLKPATAATLTSFERTCADVGFVKHAFEPLLAVGGSGLARAASLPRGRPVALAVTPGGPPSLQLQPGRGDALGITVLEERQGMSRLAWPTGDVVAFGWTPTAALSRAPAVGNERGDGIGLGSIGTSSGAIHCDHELPMVVEVDGERRTVARIRPGTLFVRGPEVDEYQRITLLERGVMPTPEATWLVKKTALVGCQ